jgi:hypothetical protein
LYALGKSRNYGSVRLAPIIAGGLAGAVHQQLRRPGERGHHTMRFTAKVIPSGNATAVEVPKAALDELNAGARPLVVITINGHSWRSRVAAMRGMHLVGISAANRKASQISEGDLVEILLELDVEPRTVEEPQDLESALNSYPLWSLTIPVRG